MDYLAFGDKGSWNKFRTFIVVLFVGGPTAFAVISLHESYLSQQLSDHGTNTFGIVRLLYDERFKGHTSHYANFEYSVNGKTWVQNVRNNDHTLFVGDTLKLRCSTEDPEVFELVNKKNDSVKTAD